jgi:hypothetical protein
MIIPTYSSADSVRDDIYHMLAEAEAQSDMKPFMFKYKTFLFSCYLESFGEPMVEVIDIKSDLLIETFDLSSFDEDAVELVIMDILTLIS